VTVLDSSQGRDSAAAFTKAFNELVDICIAQDTFRLIAKRHSEPFAVLSYPTSHDEGGTGSGTVTMERFMAPLFGILLRGAHMIAYVRSRATEDDCGVISGLWIPRRAKHLFSSPNMLDATVAGGIAAGTSALETIIKEAGEEAALSPELVRTRVRSTGLLTYVSSTDAIHGWPGESGLLCPGIVYTYDMELPVDVVPKPHDGEVGSYSLMSIGAVQAALLNNEFKPDSAVVVIDFLIRHGIITADNERNFIPINEHIHRRLPFRVAERR
jgi:8-oxo-dGTP pyrophosphatase MutT (NUDIX family)